MVLLVLSVAVLIVTCFFPATPAEEASFTQHPSSLGACAIVGVGAPIGPVNPTPGAVVDVPSTTRIDCTGYRFTPAGIVQLVFAGLVGAFLAVLLSWMPGKRWALVGNVTVLAACFIAFMSTFLVHTTSVTLPSGRTAAASRWDIFLLALPSNISSIAVGVAIGILANILLESFRPKATALEAIGGRENR